MPARAEGIVILIGERNKLSLNIIRQNLRKQNHHKHSRNNKRQADCEYFFIRAAGKHNRKPDHTDYYRAGHMIFRKYQNTINCNDCGGIEDSVLHRAHPFMISAYIRGKHDSQREFCHIGRLKLKEAGNLDISFKRFALIGGNIGVVKQNKHKQKQSQPKPILCRCLKNFIIDF